MTTTVIEMVQYRLKETTTLEQLRATHEGVQNFLLAQDGFYYRSLSLGENDMWFDIAYWQDMDAAKNAQKAFESAPEGQALLELIDLANCEMSLMTAEAEAANCESA